MTYNQKGSKSILRTFHFIPISYAFFVVNCLRKDCVDGVASSDIGKVIGKQGKTAQAMRTIMSAAGTKLDKRYVLEILD